MKREFLIELIPDATKEVIDQILDANGKDIENAQGSHKKTKEDLAAANQKIAEYEQEIESLKDATANADALKLKVAELEKSIQERKDADEKEKAEAAVTSRFDAVVGEKQFLNDFTRTGVLNEFKAAIADKVNVGKSDSDILTALVKDREGIFANPNPPASIPGTGNIDAEKLDESRVRAIMGLPEKK